MLLLKIIERLQEEIDTWKETENDYEHELARKDEEIEEMREELEIQKRLVIEQIKRFAELYHPVYGIGEQGLDELANKILSFSKDYISKEKIRESFEKYNKDIAWANADDHYYFVKYINELLEENK